MLGEVVHQLRELRRDVEPVGEGGRGCEREVGGSIPDLGASRPRRDLPRAQQRPELLEVAQEFSKFEVLARDAGALVQLSQLGARHRARVVREDVVRGNRRDVPHQLQRLIQPVPLLEERHRVVQSVARHFSRLLVSGSERGRHSRGIRAVGTRKRGSGHPRRFVGFPRGMSTAVSARACD